MKYVLLAILAVLFLYMSFGLIAMQDASRF